MIPALEVKNLSFKDGEHQILENVNFELAKGQAIGIIGPNGGGKSTLLKILTGLIEPSDGSINYFGKTQIPYSKIAYIPQDPVFNNTLPMTVKELVLIEDYDNKLAKKAQKIIAQIGLEGKEQYLVKNLSGGERQRALIAKALMHDPEILLLDEPTTGLDANGEDQLLSFLDELKSNFQTSIILIEHNLNQVLKFCDNILCLNKSHHWHDHKSRLNKEVLESIYHCEFEHAILHDQNTPGEHIHCDKHGPTHGEESE